MAERPWSEESDGLSPRMREVLASAREDEPSRDEVDALELKLAPMLGLAGASAFGPAAAAKAVGSLKLKVLVGVLVATPALWVGHQAVSHYRQKAQIAAPVVAPVPEVEPLVEDEPEVETLEPANTKPPRPKTHKYPRPAAETLAEEAVLLEEARGLLGSDAAGALRVLEDHRHRFSRGALVQERELLAIDALSRLGRNDSARARGQQFLEKYPKSAHAHQVEVILERSRP